MAGLFVTANFLLRGLAIALVAPPATDRVRPLRLTAAALWLAWLAVIVLLSLHGNTGTSSVVEDIVMLLSFAGVEVLALAAFDLSYGSYTQWTIVSMLAYS